MAHFTPRSIERLIDLVENKLSCLDIVDREDRMEAKLLQRALQELRQYERGGAPALRVAHPAHQSVAA